MDEMFLVGDLPRIVKAYNIISEFFSKIGLELNQKACGAVLISED